MLICVNIVYEESDPMPDFDRYRPSSPGENYWKGFKAPAIKLLIRNRYKKNNNQGNPFGQPGRKEPASMKIT